MTREQAVDAAGHAIYAANPERSAGAVSRARAAEIVAALEALGLVKFEEPQLDALYVAAARPTVEGAEHFVAVKTASAIDALSKAGYGVCKLGQQSGSNFANQVGQSAGLGAMCQGKP